jgi:tRNA threonylcarbamoyladenosine biosynthesis protein TsaB
MLILSIRTDKPEAEIGLFNGEQKLGYEVWPAHRQLSTTMHLKIDELLRGPDKTWQDIQGIIVFKGPGSFTGLRIGLSVANALAYALQVPIVAVSDPRWLENGITGLLSGQNEKIALPEYGAPAHITQPKH